MVWLLAAWFAIDAIALAVVLLSQWYGRRVDELRGRQEAILRLALTVHSLREPSAARHAAATGMYARDLAAAAGLTEDEQSLAHTCGLLHDLDRAGLSQDAFASFMGDAGLTYAGHVITGERERGSSVAVLAATVAVAETYDRGGPDPDKAAESLRRAAQTHLDPQLVELFIDRVAPLRAGGLADRRGGRFGRRAISPAEAPPPG